MFQDQNIRRKCVGRGRWGQHGHSLYGNSQKSIPYLNRKHCNLYSSATGDWLTFTSPVERRKIEKGGERGRGLDVRPARMDVCEEGEERTLQDESLSRGCGLILPAGCLRTNQSGGWPSEPLSGSTDMKLSAQCCPISLNLSNIYNQELILKALPHNQEEPSVLNCSVLN